MGGMGGLGRVGIRVASTVLARTAAQTGGAGANAAKKGVLNVASNGFLKELAAAGMQSIGEDYSKDKFHQLVGGEKNHKYCRLTPQVDASIVAITQVSVRTIQNLINFLTGTKPQAPQQEEGPSEEGSSNPPVTS
jgi:hypothetical protein